MLLFGVAVIAGSGALGLGETLLLAYAGGVLGDLSSYWIGRRFHQNIRRLPGLRSHPQWITAAEVYFEPVSYTHLGAATPEPDSPFSTITATAICGLLAGAKPTNRAWSRCRSSSLERS